MKAKGKEEEDGRCNQKKLIPWGGGTTTAAKFKNFKQLSKSGKEERRVEAGKTDHEGHK